MRIYSKHFRAAGMCGPGAVAKMKAVGMNNHQIVDALQNGIEEEEIRSFRIDAQINQVIELAHRTENENNG
jgi:hypothetical protein